LRVGAGHSSGLLLPFRPVYFPCTSLASGHF